MSIAFYADYVSDLRILLTELDSEPERFQTFDARLELAVPGGLIVYETRRRKGQTDSLYYGRSSDNAANQRISQAAAFSAIDRFLALGQFVALAGDTAFADEQRRPIDPQYPHCAVNFSYRKKGHPSARSMLMVFIGLNDETDALGYAETIAGPNELVQERPHHSARFHEWR